MICSIAKCLAIWILVAELARLLLVFSVEWLKAF